MSHLIRLPYSIAGGWSATPLWVVAYIHFSTVKGKTVVPDIPVKLCTAADVNQYDIISSGNTFVTGSATTEEINQYALKKGDIVIAREATSLDNIGKPTLVAETLHHLMPNERLAIITHIDPLLIPTYVFWCLRSRVIRGQLDSLATGTIRYRISMSSLKSVKIPMPDIDVQEKIIAFLDREVAEIDELILIKNNLLATIEEKRELVIAELLGNNRELPADWYLTKLKYLAEMKVGHFISPHRVSAEATCIPVFGGNGVRGYTSEQTHHGDYVIIGRQGALCGNVHYAHGDFWATDHAIVCTPKMKYNLTWLGESLRSMTLRQYATGVAQPGLSVETIKNLEIRVPPIAQQQEIADSILENVAIFEELHQATVQSIALLREKKEALITAAVTGQIAIPLYDN